MKRGEGCKPPLVALALRYVCNGSRASRFLSGARQHGIDADHVPYLASPSQKKGPSGARLGPFFRERGMPSPLVDVIVPRGNLSLNRVKPAFFMPLASALHADLW